MDFDPNPDLRAELLLALTVLEPKIHGLTELSKIVAPGPLQDLVNRELAAAQRRHDLIRGVILRLDRVVDYRTQLATTGYPAVETLELSAELYAELQGDLEALRIAGSIFAQQAEAASIKVTLGRPVDKT